jgi:molybdate transport system permease protein
MLLSPEEITALLLSLKVAAACVAVALVPGVGAAWLLARRSFRGKTVIDALIHAPLVMPPVVVGYLLLVALGRNGLDLHVAFTWRAAVIASAVMGFPLLVRAARLSIEAVDPRLEQAAATLGASPRRVFMTITLPGALPGIMTGMVLAFARSLGEFGATIMFAGNIEGRTQTLPLAIYNLTQRADGDAAAARLVVISIIIALGALVASELIANRLRKARGGAP